MGPGVEIMPVGVSLIKRDGTVGQIVDKTTTKPPADLRQGKDLTQFTTIPDMPGEKIRYEGMGSSSLWDVTVKNLASALRKLI